MSTEVLTREPSEERRRGRPAAFSGLPARELFIGAPSPDRIFYHGRWGRRNHNARYTRLLPRLRRLDPFLIGVSDKPIIRGAQHRVLMATTPWRYRLVFRAANRRYRWMFTTEYRQITHFKGRVVADLDDPVFSGEQVELLNRPNVAAYVVTTESARSRFEQLGVTTPAHVVSQGVDLASLDQAEAARVAARHRRPGEVTVGYVAKWLKADPDGKGNHPLDGIRHLLELWDGIRARVPSGRLWLIGEPDRAAREICAERTDVLLVGPVPQQRVATYLANFDIALYPRRVDHAPMPIKLVEYIAFGVPTVSYDLELAQILRETGTGRLAGTPDEFVHEVERLSRDEPERARMSATAKRLAPGFDWDALAERYQADVLDRYLR
jgi:glycosyltransferase involved in cell wall biosynthesis